MDLPIIISWVSPVTSIFKGVTSEFKFSYKFLMKILLANRIAPDGMPRCAASHLGLYCLPMSQKRAPGLSELKFHYKSFFSDTRFVRTDAYYCFVSLLFPKIYIICLSFVNKTQINLNLLQVAGFT